MGKDGTCNAVRDVFNLDLSNLNLNSSSNPRLQDGTNLINSSIRPWSITYHNIITTPPTTYPMINVQIILTVLAADSVTKLYNTELSNIVSYKDRCSLFRCDDVEWLKVLHVVVELLVMSVGTLRQPCMDLLVKESTDRN